MSGGGQEQFGDYRLVGRLGRGGMGEAWRAVREGPQGISKEVVIKRILRAYSDDPQFRESFIQEARLSARLSHGNVAQVFDFGEVNGEYYMALEYVHGASLAQGLERARKLGLTGLPPEVAAYIAIEILKGLSHAHTRVDANGEPLRIVHRDVSPDNVMLSFEGEVKLVDFGIAKARQRGRSETEPGLLKGKVHYLSPEQARGEPLDARSDVWSAGLVLYEMLAGVPALEGQLHEVLHQLAKGTLRPLKVRAPGLPEGLTDVVARAVVAERERRFPTALAFGEALGAWLHRAAPDLSQSSLAGTMAWLFRHELVSEGRTPTIPAAVQVLLGARSAQPPTQDDLPVVPERRQPPLEPTPLAARVMATPTSPEYATPIATRPQRVATRAPPQLKISAAWILVPLLVVLAAASYVVYDLWRESQQATDREKELVQPKPELRPTAVRREPRVVEPPPLVEPPPAVSAPDEDLGALRVPTPKGTARKKPGKATAAEMAYAEMLAAYDEYVEKNGRGGPFTVKRHAQCEKPEKSEKMSSSEESIYVVGCSRLRDELRAAYDSLAP